MADHHQDLMIYRTDDGQASVALVARDWSVWRSQAQLAELLLHQNSKLLTRLNAMIPSGQG